MRGGQRRRTREHGGGTAVGSRGSSHDTTSTPAVTLKASTDTYTKRMVSVSGAIRKKARAADPTWNDRKLDYTWMSRKIALTSAYFVISQ